METSLTSLAETLDERQTNAGRLESLVSASPVAMYTCKADGGFATTFVTQGVRSLWSYEPEDFLRDPRFWTDRIHPEDSPRVFEQFSRVLQGASHGYDYRFRTASGRYRWMHDEVRLVRDAAGSPLEIAGYCFDITEQKLAEAALRESEALQKVIFNSTSDLQALYRVQSDGSFVTEAMNRAMAENFQSRMARNGADFIGRDLVYLLAETGLSAEEIESRLTLYRRAVEERKTVHFESPASAMRDPFEISASPIMDQQENCTHLLWNGRNISKRVRAEAERRESEERYALVTEAIHEGIFDWNLATGAYYLSPRYKEILGYRDDELPNHLQSFFARIHPHDRAQMSAAVESYQRDPSKDRFFDELRLQHRDGTYRWVVSRGRILRNEQGEPIRFVGAIGDMTDRVESAAKLAANEKRLRDILNSLLGFVGLFTPDGKLIDCNDTSLEEQGLKPEEVLGKPFWETPGWKYDPEEQIRVRSMMLRAAEGEVVRFETKVRDLNRQQIIVDFTFRPLRDPSGKVHHIIGHAVDITARKQAEAELIHAKEAAESSNRAKSEFLANMSHEIRTPMNGVIGLTEVLLDTQLDAEQREYLTLVKNSAESLLVIINDILDVSKIEAGKLRLEPRELDVREVALDIMKTFKVQADAKGLILSCDVDPAVPQLVKGDPERLRQILINLIGNAIKFTDHGQVSAAIERSLDSADALHFAVTDTGIGIPAEKQAMIFEAFTQVDGSFTRRFGGTGLGLTIASRLVRMMDGRIWVESKEGQGSTFHFTARLQPI